MTPDMFKLCGKTVTVNEEGYYMGNIWMEWMVSGPATKVTDLTKTDLGKMVEKSVKKALGVPGKPAKLEKEHYSVYGTKDINIRDIDFAKAGRDLRRDRTTQGLWERRLRAMGVGERSMTVAIVAIAAAKANLEGAFTEAFGELPSKVQSHLCDVMFGEGWK